MFTITLDLGAGITLTFRNSMRNVRRVDAIKKALENGAKDESYERDNFAWVAGHCVAVTGWAWKPPDYRAAKKDIEASFEQFDSEIPFQLFQRCIQAVNELHAPLADAVEKPDAALTADEEADPN